MPELGNRRSKVEVAARLPGNRLPGALSMPHVLRAGTNAGQVAQKSLEAGVLTDADVGGAVQAYAARLQAYGEGQVVLPVQSITASASVSPNATIVLADATTAPVTVTLPDAATSNGRQITVKKTDASGNAVTVDGDGANIDGSGTYSLAAQNDYVTVLCDSIEWRVIAAS